MSYEINRADLQNLCFGQEWPSRGFVRTIDRFAPLKSIRI
jgi:hypothetical protein